MTYTFHQRQRTAFQDTQPREIEPGDLLRHYPKAWPSCTGPCDQGRKLCPCPEDCQRPDDDPPRGRFDATCVMVWIFGVSIGGLAIWAAVSAFLLALKS